jgi:hypothetical protein
MGWKEGERWRCINPGCGSEVIVMNSGTVDGNENPRCCRGSVMKRPYEPPEEKKLEDPDETEKRRKALKHWTRDCGSSAKFLGEMKWLGIVRDHLGARRSVSGGLPIETLGR